MTEHAWRTRVLEWRITRNRLLSAGAWIGVWLMAFLAVDFQPADYGDVAYFALFGFRFVPIPAAIGALFGRALWCMLFGVALYLAWVGWVLVALGSWGGTA
jgi:hypothetical protein